MCIRCITYSQGYKTNVIQINLGTTQYKKLTLRVQCYNKPNPDYDMRFPGFQNGKIWSFCYPDSLYDKSFSFTIEDAAYNNNDTLKRNIGFKYIRDNDTLWATSVSFANYDTTLVNTIYLQTDTFPNIFAKDKNGSTILRTYLIDFYLLKSYHDKELMSSIEATQAKFYWLGGADSSQYDTEMDKYIDLVEKYPYSHSLIEMLNNLRLGSILHSKTDVKKVFDCFSQNQKDSYFGKRIRQYLDKDNNYFKNSTLKAWNTGKPEVIVSDTTKYNLVIFSASWCVPCIKEIPLLKKIYNDLSNKLDMTYVSTDDSKTIEAWRQLMRKENITWRSVVTANDIDNNNIKEKYYVHGVPYCLFIHPGGFMEPIDVRKTEELSYLYQAVK